MKNNDLYIDIINMPHHISEKRAQMLVRDRAAQFAPFAALTGHNEAIRETARLTYKKIELDENEKSMLNEKIRLLLSLEVKPEVEVTYFKPDNKKSGGAYITKIGKIINFNDYEKRVIFKNGESLHIEQIYTIEADIFEGYGFY